MFLRHWFVAVCGVAPLRLVIIQTHVLGVKVDGPCVLGHIEMRPVRRQVVLLTHFREVAIGGELNRLQIRSAHGLGRGLQGLSGIHRLRGRCSGTQCGEGNEESYKEPKLSRHVCLLMGSGESGAGQPNLEARLYVDTESPSKRFCYRGWFNQCRSRLLGPRSRLDAIQPIDDFR